MLTDDDLTRQLGSAFRAEAGDLEYAGRVPTLRRTATVAIPVAATLAAAAVLTAVAVTNADSPAGDGATVADPGATTSSGPSPKPRLVTEKVHVAGYTFTYRHAVGDELADDLYAVMNPGEVPADATPIDAPEPAKAWIGTDPVSGDTGLYVDAPTRNEGHLFALLSPTWTAEQLTDLFHNGTRVRLSVPSVTR